MIEGFLKPNMKTAFFKNTSRWVGVKLPSFPLNTALNKSILAYESPHFIKNSTNMREFIAVVIDVLNFCPQKLRDIKFAGFWLKNNLIISLRK